MQISRNISLLVSQEEANIILSALYKYDGPYLPGASLSLEEGNRKYRMNKLAEAMVSSIQELLMDMYEEEMMAKYKC